MLAKLRAQKDVLGLPKTEAPTKPTSKLSALAKSRGLGLSGLSQSELPKGLLGLKLSLATTSAPLLVRKSNLQNLRRPAKAKANEVPKPDLMGVDKPEVPKVATKRKAEEPETQKIKLDISVKQSLLSTPENSISVFLFENLVTLPSENSNKRRQLAPDLFRAYTNRFPHIVKAKSNFSKPSPDDKVLEAQKQAFNQDMAKLSIKETTPQAEKKPTATKPFKKLDLAKELAGTNFSKPEKSFVIIGHVDAGKSTLMGRILYDLGTVDVKTVNKLVREAEKSGKGSFALAWIMDQTTEERSRGVTIDICATSFETANTKFTAIDAPGHKDFVPQMIGGVSQADMALLVVDSITGEFEAGFNMDGQTKEHTLLAKNLGIDKICVAVNKMDKENWSEHRFEDIKGQLLQFLTADDVGFQKENVFFVPISGLTGVNVVKNDNSTSALSWYKGPTLVECLESVVISGVGATTAAELELADFTLAINDIYDVTSSEFKVKGKVSLGIVQPGQTVAVYPTEDYLQVQSLFLGEKQVDVAIRGQIVSMTFKVNQLKNKSTDDLAIGDIVLNVGSQVESARKFEATVNMFNMEKPLLVGTPFVLFRNNASVAARISKIVAINGSKKKKMHLVSKQSADVIIEISGDRLVPVTRFEDNKALGKVVIRREGATVGAGIVTGAEE